MTTKKLKQEIIECAEKLFLESGFLNFDIAHLSKHLNIDSAIILNIFISKGGLLLSILSEIYIEVFTINNSFNRGYYSNVLKRDIFYKLTYKHEKKITLFISLFERNEINILDSYIISLLRKTTNLHFRLFLFQYNNENEKLKKEKIKYSYYSFLEKFKTVEFEYN
ncbi:hypothetical protein [Chryseobacterium lathyri]|uniref:AcrR family transcriptional regulator n=1 Tax=Chryseobacterium lathyri TaxID=395933 RepID=A0ABT9STW7_9FLAO|nr:hypothetical protein [Chryseobacterium lathyri]MDP9961855.1 AcrR family transcriptional regulator [Chryseobacterium lathyri]MDQ0064208.1 AcrR family transcriptional regulator [Chryseobacterium lathyri]